MLIFCYQGEAFSFLLLFLATCQLLIHSSICATDTLIFKPTKLNCSTDSFAEDVDTIQTSLEVLFSSMRSKALCSNSGNRTIGLHGPETIYGSFLCQGDLSHEDCQTCIHIAATNLFRRCSSSRRAAIWFDRCQLHYILEVADTHDGAGLANHHEQTKSMKPIGVASEPLKVANYWRRLMDAPRTTSGDDGGYFLACFLRISFKIHTLLSYILEPMDGSNCLFIIISAA